MPVELWWGPDVTGIYQCFTVYAGVRELKARSEPTGTDSGALHTCNFIVSHLGYCWREVRVSVIGDLSFAVEVMLSFGSPRILKKFLGPSLSH